MKLRVRLLGLPAEDYPTLPTVNVAEGFTIPLGELKTMVAHEETRFQLNGALLKIQPNKMEMVATDGHRMALINFPSGITGAKGKNGSVPARSERKCRQPPGSEAALNRGR